MSNLVQFTPDFDYTIDNIIYIFNKVILANIKPINIKTIFQTELLFIIEIDYNKHKLLGHDLIIIAALDIFVTKGFIIQKEISYLTNNNNKLDKYYCYIKFNIKDYLISDTLNLSVQPININIVADTIFGSAENRLITYNLLYNNIQKKINHDVHLLCKHFNNELNLYLNDNYNNSDYINIDVIKYNVEAVNIFKDQLARLGYHIVGNLNISLTRFHTIHSNKYLTNNIIHSSKIHDHNMVKNYIITINDLILINKNNIRILIEKKYSKKLIKQFRIQNISECWYDKNGFLNIEFL